MLHKTSGLVLMVWLVVAGCDAQVPSVLIKSTGKTATGTFLLSTTGGQASQSTNASLTFDDNYLWVNYAAADNSIYSPYSSCNEDLYTADTVECFVGPASTVSNSGGVSTYFEMEVSPYGVLFVSNVTNSNGQCSGIKGDLVNCTASGIVVQSRLCSPSSPCSGLPDQFLGYTVELGIPWQLLGTLNGQQKTQNWRVGLFRIDAANAAGNPPTQYQAWSPDYYNPACFHVPQYFANVALSLNE